MEKNDENNVVQNQEVSDTSSKKVLDSDSSSTDSQQVQKQKKGKKGFLRFVIVVLICTIGFSGFLYANKLKGTEKVETKTKNVTSNYRMSGNDLSEFDLSFLKLENEAKNKIYSPLSIKYALEMVAEGANGDTKKEIDAVVGEYKAKSYTNSPNMSFANAMFIRDTYKDNVKSDYTTKLSTKYNAEVRLDPFASPDNINSWVKEKTLGLIDNAVDDVSQNDFFLINALAIDMNWNNQIHCAVGSEVPCLVNNYHIKYHHEKIKDDDKWAYSNTSYEYTDFPKMDFEGQEGKFEYSQVLADFNRYDIITELGEDKIREEVTAAYNEWLKEGDNSNYQWYDSNIVPHVATEVDLYIDNYMEQLKSNYNSAINNTDFYLYTDNNVKVFAKDLKEYDGLNLQYVGIMPKEQELTKYIDNVKAKDISDIISNLKEVKIDNFKEGVVTIIHGNIPFFKYDYELSLMEDLQKLGIKKAFTKDADLSNMVKGPASLNKAIHKANIEFSNDGIKAGAITAMGGAGAATGGFEYLFKVPVEEIDLDFNKPYMYIIRDKSSGEVWFAGSVYQPGK